MSDRNQREIEERLERIEAQIAQGRVGGGGVGCCGGLALAYIVYLLWQIRDALVQ